MVCATAPVMGAESTRSLTESTRCGARRRHRRAAHLGGDRSRRRRATLRAERHRGERELIGREHLRVRLRACGHARRAPPSLLRRDPGDEIDPHRLGVPLWSSSATRPSTGADCATTATPVRGLERRRHVALRRARRRRVDRAGRRRTDAATSRRCSRRAQATAPIGARAAQAPPRTGARRRRRRTAERLEPGPTGRREAPVPESRCRCRRTKTDTTAVADTAIGVDVRVAARATGTPVHDPPTMSVAEDARRRCRARRRRRAGRTAARWQGRDVQCPADRLPAAPTCRVKRRTQIASSPLTDEHVHGRSTVAHRGSGPVSEPPSCVHGPRAAAREAAVPERPSVPPDEHVQRRSVLAPRPGRTSSSPLSDVASLTTRRSSMRPVPELPLSTPRPNT